MDTELIQCLHKLSTRANKIILSKIDINHIFQIDNEFELDQFLDLKCYGLQDDIINVNEKTISIIVKNLVSAIDSSCGNSIDLTKYSKEDYFDYSFSEDPNERSVYKRYKINSFSPKDISIFKEIWLFNFLENLKTILFNIKYILNLTQQEDIKNPDEVEKELHNNIFKYNAFETFEKYFENKKITQNSRTDLRVIFDLLEGDDLLVETVELKHYIKWLNSQFDYNLFELKKLDLNTRPNIQRANDYNDYKKATLKKP